MEPWKNMPLQTQHFPSTSSRGDLFFCSEQCIPAESEKKPPILVGDDTASAEVELRTNQIFYKDQCFSIDADNTPLLGHHNYYDIAFVYAVCQEFDISDEQFAKGLSTYQTLPHRLQLWQLRRNPLLR